MEGHNVMFTLHRRYPKGLCWNPFCFFATYMTCLNQCHHKSVFLQTIACYTDRSRRIKITLRYKMILTTLKSGLQHGACVLMRPNVTYSVSRNQQHTSIDLTTLYLKKSKTICIWSLNIKRSEMD